MVAGFWPWFNVLIPSATSSKSVNVLFVRLKGKNQTWRIIVQTTNTIFFWIWRCIKFLERIALPTSFRYESFPHLMLSNVVCLSLFLCSLRLFVAMIYNSFYIYYISLTFSVKKSCHEFHGDCDGPLSRLEAWSWGY